MVRYTLTSGLVATLTPIMSLTKWVTLSSSFAMVGILVILILFTRVKFKLNNKKHKI